MLELEHCCISNCKLVLFAENNEFQEEETDLSNDICFLPSSLYFVLNNNDETFDVFFFLLKQSLSSSWEAYCKLETKQNWNLSRYEKWVCPLKCQKGKPSLRVGGMLSFSPRQARSSHMYYSVLHLLLSSSGRSPPPPPCLLQPPQPRSASRLTRGGRGRRARREAPYPGRGGRVEPSSPCLFSPERGIPHPCLGPSCHSCPACYIWREAGPALYKSAAGGLGVPEWLVGCWTWRAGRLQQQRRRWQCGPQNAPAAATMASWCQWKATPASAAGSSASATSALSSPSARRSWQPRRRCGSRCPMPLSGWLWAPLPQGKTSRPAPLSRAATWGRRAASPPAAVTKARHAGVCLHLLLALLFGTTVRLQLPERGSHLHLPSACTVQCAALLLFFVRQGLQRDSWSSFVARLKLQQVALL